MLTRSQLSPLSVWFHTLPTTVAKAVRNKDLPHIFIPYVKYFGQVTTFLTKELVLLIYLEKTY